MNDYSPNLDVSLERAKYQQETPLTKAIALFKQEFGKSPSASEMAMLIYQLGGTTVRPSDIGPDGLTFRPPVLGRPKMDEINRKIIEIVDSVAREYGWEPELVPTTEYGIRRDVLQQTATEFLDAQYTTGELFPEFSPFVSKKWDEDAEEYEEKALSAVREDGTAISGVGDILYEDFLSAIESVTGGKEIQPGVVNSVRYWWWKANERRKFDSFADIQNSIAGLFKASNAAIPKRIVDKALTEYAQVEKLKHDATLFRSNSPIHPVTLKNATEKAHVTEEENELVKEYNRLYGVSDDAIYRRDTINLTTVFNSPELVQWKSRDEIPPKVYRVMINKNIDIGKIGPLGDARLESAISTVLSNLLQSGAIPHTALKSILSGQVIRGRSLYTQLISYVKGMAVLDPRYNEMSERMAVESLIGGKGGLAEQIRDFEHEKFFGAGQEVSKKFDELIARTQAEDPTGVHTAALNELINTKILLVDQVIMEYQHHRKLQQLNQDGASVIGEPPPTPEPFDFDSAVADVFKQAWIPLKEKSISSVAEEQSGLDAQAAIDTRAARDIANALASQETTGAFAAYRDAAWRTWTAQGKNPDDFNIDLMNRFANNGSDPNRAAMSLSRELYDAQTVDGVSLPGNVKIFQDFVKVREQQTMRADTAKLLQQFPTVEAAIASPIGRAALEKLAPGLTGEDEAEIASLEALLAKVQLNPTGAHEGYKSKGHDIYTEDEILGRIAGVRTRPAERFQQQLDARAKGMPLPNLEAMFGFDTGGVDVSQEAWFNAFLAKEKTLWTWDDQRFLAGIPEEDREDVLELLGKEGGLARLQGMFDAGFSIPDVAYYIEVDAAREAAGLVDTEGHRRGVGTEKEIPYWDTEEKKWKLRAESVEDWQERVGGAIDPKEPSGEPYVDPYPELTEAGTYDVGPGKTLTIPEGGKIPQPEPEEEAPGEYSRRTLFAQAEGAARMASQRRRKLASDQTFEQFVASMLPAELAKFRKERATEAASFTGGRARRTRMTGGRRVRF